MADFTGFNPTQAKNEVETLKGVIRAANRDLWQLFGGIDINLKEIWASPKAVEFGSTYAPQISELCTTYANNGTTIISNAVRAIGTIARANGSSCVIDPEEIIAFTANNNFKEEKDGVVGMNVAQVELYLQEFDNKLKTFYNDFSRLEEMDISLFDPSGSLKAAFKAMLTSFETSFNETIEAIKKAINTATTTEINTVRLAKESAASEMAA